ncbi:MAG: HPP family protein [Planctomycetes bacterium]|nr:HPP family protein [Planctomycetota bacterium]
MFQSFLAAGFMMLLLSLLLGVVDLIVMASLASTAFLIFARPRSYSAHPRRSVGGHLSCMLIGALCALPILYFLDDGPHAMALMGGIAVGLATFVMAVTDTEHAPAAGTALAMVLRSDQLLKSGAAVVLGCLFLAGVWYLAGRRLQDLT